MLQVLDERVGSFLQRPLQDGLLVEDTCMFDLKGSSLTVTLLLGIKDFVEFESELHRNLLDCLHSVMSSLAEDGPVHADAFEHPRREDPDILTDVKEFSTARLRKCMQIALVF